MTERPSTPIPAGWYPDPRGTSQRRWWDGTAWTHALEPLAATPAWANLPGPVVNRAPSPSAPTVKRVIVENPEASQAAIAAANSVGVADGDGDGDGDGAFPTRRQLRDAEATRAMQRQLTEAAAEKPVYAVGAAGSLRAANSGAATRVASTAAAASLSEAPVHSTGSSMSSATTQAGGPYSRTHTFTPAPSPARAATPVDEPVVTGPVAVAPVTVAPVTDPPDAAAPVAAVSAAPPGEPLPAPQTAAVTVPSPTTAAAATTAPVLATSAAGDSAGAGAGAVEAAPFRPVMRRGNAAVAALGEIEYQPFGMNPNIRTGTVQRPTQAYTAAAWSIAVLPAVVAGIAAAIAVLFPEMYTPFAVTGLAIVLLFATVVLAASDRKSLVLADHTRTASAAWALLTASAYLLARAVRTHEQAGRGWAPFAVSLVVLLAAGAAVALLPALRDLTD
jgi:hypothetical protein